MTTVRAKLINVNDRVVTVQLDALSAARDVLVIRDSRADSGGVRVFKREAEDTWREIEFGTYHRDLASMANWWRGAAS